MNTVMRIAKFCTLFLLQVWILHPMNALGQYKTAYTWSTTYILNQATSGTNAWKYIAGNPVCNPNSLAVGRGDMSLWCVGAGTNTPPYIFDYVHHTWNPQTAMGGSVIALAVQSAAGQIYSLQLVSHCGVAWGKQFYGIFSWNSSSSKWTEPNTSSCATEISVGSDNFLVSVGDDSQNGVQALYYSTDGGVTWTLWSDSWTFVDMQNQNMGCAINSSGSIYQVNLGESPTSVLNIPSGTPAGCVNSQGAFIAWNTAGAGYILKSDFSGWLTMSNTSAKQMVALSNQLIFALDPSGKAYHWNIFAPSITLTMTGTYDKFPMNMNPTPQHTSYVKVTFPHGINTAAASKQQIPYNGAMNNVYSDTAPQCDPFFGDGTVDPECVPTLDNNTADCSSAGPIDPSDPPEPSGPLMSMDVRDYVYDKQDYGPTLFTTGLTSYWLGQVDILTNNGCIASVPTCPMTAQTDTITDWWIEPFPTGNSTQNAAAWNAALNGMAASRNGKTAPWLYPVPYFLDSNGQPECRYPPNAPGATIATWHQLDVPPCE